MSASRTSRLAGFPIRIARAAARPVRPMLFSTMTWVQRCVHTPLNLAMHRSRQPRRLEIGPGRERIEGFETINVVGGRNVDYVWDAQRRLPFRDATFSVIYASHVLEHIPWYRTLEVLREWVRVLVPGGRLELWVPNGLAICEAFVEAEKNGTRTFEADGWYRFNPDRDPCLWAQGRIFSYGDGTGTNDHPNWHRALFSPRLLEDLLRKAGCGRIELLNHSQVRGYDHGWINLGMAGIKD